MFAIVASCYPSDRTEAQRYYDLGVSYIKSDLYDDGLKTLNQVAFLYPDSDVADDALYKLALIRERVGNGGLNIAWEESLEAQEEVLEGLTGRLIPDIIISVTAILAGEIVFDAEKEGAITQYLLALDYLNTLSQRYPDSDKLGESNLAFKRIAAKIDALIYKGNPKPPKPPRPVDTKRDIIMIGAIAGGISSVIFLMITLSKIL